jgi:hypothetical protein
MQTAVVASVKTKLFPGIREGDLNMHDLVSGNPNSLANYHAALSTADTEYAVPRHRHNFEQVRYIVSGDVRFGKTRLSSGWVGYFPEGVPYGPQVRTLGMKIFTVQFGGPSRNGFVARRQFESASEELKKKGSFEKGSFTYFDDDGKRHRKDAYEAVWEHAMGRKLTYPKPRYKDFVSMNPENFEWVEDEGTGRAYKWLGTFTERGTRIGLVRLERGATLTAGMHDAPELLFVVKGEVSCRGDDFPEMSTFGFEPKEGAVPFKANEDSEILCLQMPKL